jgi:hypothetical protein
MIKIIVLPLLAVLSLSAYSQKMSPESVLNNPDSVKKIIIMLNDECYHSYDNPKKFQSFCEDSMLVLRDDVFMTSSNAMSQDLIRISVFPHDYTFKLSGNTAIISYLWAGYEIFNGDTIFYSGRNLRTFALNNGKWKIAVNASGSHSVNYFKPVAEINQKNYSSYAGIYKENATFDTVFVKDGKLYDKSGGDPTWDFPVNNSEYMTIENLERITFGKDSAGTISYFTVIEPDGQKFRCPKIK